MSDIVYIVGFICMAIIGCALLVWAAYKERQLYKRQVAMFERWDQEAEEKGREEDMRHLERRAVNAFGNDKISFMWQMRDEDHDEYEVRIALYPFGPHYVFADADYREMMRKCYRFLELKEEGEL